MNISRLIAIPAVALLLAACGSSFEWFPNVPDTTPPTVTATIAGSPLFANRTTHFVPLGSHVTFSANEPATIYYTTDNTEPSISSPNVFVSLSGLGPSIAISDSILKFFGIDTASNQSATQTSYLQSP